MGEDVHAAIRSMGQAGRIVVVHFRNVRGAMPRFQETFVDEGDVEQAILMLLEIEKTVVEGAGAAVVFNAGDNVLFDDSSTNPAVNLVGAISPAAATVTFRLTRAATAV